MAKQIHVHLHLHGFDNIVQGLSDIQQTLQEGFARMSEVSDALTTAVAEVAGRVDTLSSSLQVELQEISNALANTGGDAELRQVAVDSANRLSSVSSQLDSLNQIVQGIIP